MISNLIPLHGLAVWVSKRALVLKEIPEINERGPVYVRIVGRKSGLVSWVLTKFGIDRTVTLTVYERRVEFTEQTLSGHRKRVYPATALSTFESLNLRPFLYLVLAPFLFVGMLSLGITAAKNNPFSSGILELGGGLLFGIVLAALFIFLYFINKCMGFQATSHSGVGFYIFIKRSLIENIPLDESDADRIAAIAAHLIEENQKVNAFIPGSMAPAPPPRQAAPQRAAPAPRQPVKTNVTDIPTDQIPETDIVFVCHQCRKQYSCDPSFAGFEYTCTDCGTSLVIPRKP